MIPIAKDLTYTQLGASNHAKDTRQKDDYYATDPQAIDHLLKFESFNTNIVEPCAGEGHLAKKLIEYGYNVKSYDLIDRGYAEIKNVFDLKEIDGDIITNPPYKEATEIINHLLSIMKPGQKMAMFLRVLFLESQKRYILFNQYPLKTLYIFSKRIVCAKNGDFINNNSAAVAYGWFIWVKGYQGETTLKWISP